MTGGRVMTGAPVGRAGRRSGGRAGGAAGGRLGVGGYRGEDAVPSRCWNIHLDEAVRTVSPPRAAWPAEPGDHRRVDAGDHI
jgi:hypothetical protein